MPCPLFCTAATPAPHRPRPGGRRALRHQLQQVGLQGELHKLLLEYSRVGQALTADDALDVLQVRGSSTNAMQARRGQQRR